MGEIELRAMERDDATLLSAEFANMGWSKPGSCFIKYVEEESLGLRRTWVAVREGQLLGYVTLLWASEDPVLGAGAIPEICDLNVFPEHRRKGVATVLMDAAELAAEERSGGVGLRVGLHSGYGPAQRLYVRRGYVPDGRGVVIGTSMPDEGATVSLDDDTTLRLILDRHTSGST